MPSIERRARPKCFDTAFHDARDRSYRFWMVKRLGVHDKATAAIRCEPRDTRGLTQNRYVRVVCGKQNLTLGGSLPDRAYQGLYDEGVVEMILGLINDQNTIRILQQD
jgi:hypothetical protein